MSSYRLTPEASRDLDEIYDYIAQNNPGAAARVIEKIERRCQQLANLLLMGASCEHLSPGLRQSPVGKYIIFYRPAADGVEVIRVLHGARDIPSLFQ